MPKESLTNFTSTGEKLLCWLDTLSIMQKTHLPTPINLQISPTNKCNLNCSFCSVANRDKKLEIPFHHLLAFVQNMCTMNTLKAVEITGGGEPTLYPQIEQLIQWLDSQGFSIGLITNGLELTDNIERKYLDLLSWIRISTNTLQDRGRIQIPRFKKGKGPLLGFSYVYSEITEDTYKFFAELEYLAKKNKASYIRIVPNCLMDINNLEEKIKPLKAIYQESFLFQDKRPRRPNYCYLAYVKPYLYTDGWVYPCNSVSLFQGSNREFPEDTRIFHMSQAAEWTETPFKTVCLMPSEHLACQQCRFARQNELLYNILKNDFIHKEHI